ncbi:MAG: response regulator [Alphaproteobacteria bacterium]|nr:response regulator [Alphaproteobacteria bacterium]
MKILVVDDDDFIRTVLLKTLISAGYDVEESPNGAHAIDRLKTNKYNLVITDVVMPEQSGISVGEYIRKNEIQTAVLAISAYNKEGDMLDFAEYFADETLEKPFEKSQLLKIVSRLCQTGNITNALENM